MKLLGRTEHRVPARGKGAAARRAALPLGTVTTREQDIPGNGLGSVAKYIIPQKKVFVVSGKLKMWQNSSAFYAHPRLDTFRERLFRSTEALLLAFIEERAEGKKICRRTFGSRHD